MRYDRNKSAFRYASEAKNLAYRFIRVTEKSSASTLHVNIENWCWTENAFKVKDTCARVAQRHNGPGDLGVTGLFGIVLDTSRRVTVLTRRRGGSQHLTQTPSSPAIHQAPAVVSIVLNDARTRRVCADRATTFPYKLPSLAP